MVFAHNHFVAITCFQSDLLSASLERDWSFTALDVYFRRNYILQQGISIIYYNSGMHNERQNRKIGLVGKRGSGKTALMKDLIRAFRKGGLVVKGVFSPGIFEANEKIAVEIVDLASGHSRIAAKRSSIERTEFEYGDWSFYQETFDWANQQLSIVQESDVFIFDEIGPLELDLGKGLQIGLDKVRQANYNLGLFTARPKCINTLNARFPDMEIYWLKSWDREELIDKILRMVNLPK